MSAITLRIIASATFRLKIFTSRLPLNIAIIEIRITIKAVVFTPPPVDPGEAPMNISMIEVNIDPLLICAISIVLNPAVLVVTL